MRKHSSIVGMLLILAGGSAAIASGASIPALSTECSAGYRLNAVTLDPVLHRQWAWIEDCSHPERPLKAIALPEGPENSSAAHIGSAIAEDRQVPRTSPASSHPTSPLNTTSVQTVSDNAVKNLHLTATAITAQPISMGNSQISPSSSETPLIRAGERVHLWRSEANIRLEVEVIALEYGRAGQVIHFRRKDQPTELTGVVVGRDVAELMP